MNRKRLFVASYGHFSIDIINSSVPMILTLVSGRFALSIAQIGFGAMMYQISAAMSQPLFGGLTDKLHGRWVGPLGLLWTAVFFAGAALMPTYPLFISCLIVGGLGSGAFHAAGMVNASMSGGSKPTTSTSYFFLGGQSGLALGPIIVGFLVVPLGLAGMPLMALAALPGVVLMFMYMNDKLPTVSRQVTVTDAAASRNHGAATLLVTAFVLFILLRSGTSQGFATLLPSYFSSLGYAPAQFGLMLGIFSFAGALGTLLGGYLGDRYNRRTIMMMSSIASAPFAYMMLHTSGAPYIIGAIGAGMFLSMPHSILLVMAQELAPHRRGLVGGLVLGFIFASGSVMAWLEAIVAVQIGLQQVLSIVAFFPVAAGLVAFFLPTKRQEQPAPVGVPLPTAALAAD